MFRMFRTCRTSEGYGCEQCDEFFDDPIEDYEFNEAAREARDEDRADEARDMGL